MADDPIVAESRCIVFSDIPDVFWGSCPGRWFEQRPLLPGRAQKTLVGPYYKAVSCDTSSARITFITCVRATSLVFASTWMSSSILCLPTNLPP